MGILQDKVIVVTGATSGIGEAAALEIAREGGIPVLAGRREDRGEALAARIMENGGRTLYVRTDVTVESDIENMVAAALRKFGQLDGAFNNAGILDCLGPLDSITTETYQNLMDVNVRSVFWSLKYEVPAMKENGGAIVICSSTAGAVAAANFGVYISTKHNLVGLTKAAAVDYIGHGIRVNCVLPGAVDTEIWDPFPDGKAWMTALGSAAPIQRHAKPEEIAKPIAFLLSDGASYMTGSQVAVDGGYTIV